MCLPRLLKNQDAKYLQAIPTHPASKTRMHTNYLYMVKTLRDVLVAAEILRSDDVPMGSMSKRDKDQALNVSTSNKDEEIGKSRALADLEGTRDFVFSQFLGDKSDSSVTTIGYESDSDDDCAHGVS